MYYRNFLPYTSKQNCGMSSTVSLSLNQDQIVSGERKTYVEGSLQNLLSCWSSLPLLTMITLSHVKVEIQMDFLLMCSLVHGKKVSELYKLKNTNKQTSLYW